MDFIRRTLLAATFAALTAPLARAAAPKPDARAFGGGIYCKAKPQGSAQWRS